MYLKSAKQIVFEVDEEQKEFLTELKELCVHVKVKFKETDDVYKLMEEMESFISNVRQGNPFETHK